MIYVGLVEQSKKDPVYYTITQKGITYRNQFNSFVSMMENDLKSFGSKNHDPKELLADLKMRRK